MKNQSAIYKLLGANAISSFAQGMSLIAIPWYFASILNEEQYYAQAFAGITFLTFFLSLYSGTIIDRYNRKNIFLGVNATGFVVLISASIYGWINGGVPPELAIMVLGFSMFTFQIHFPNLYAFGQEVVEPNYYGRFSTLIEVQNQATIILSGLVSILLLPSQREGSFSFREALGLNIEPWDLHHIFLVDGITYGISFFLIGRIHYQAQVKRNIQIGSVWTRFKTGFQYLKERPMLMVFGIASHSVFVVSITHGFYLINLYIDNYLKESSSIYAISEVLYSVGAMTAGFLVRKVFAKTPAVSAIIYLMTIAMCAAIMLATTQFYVFMFLFQLLIGLTNAGIRVLRVTYLMNTIPNDVIGRTESIFNSTNITLRLFFVSLFTLPLFNQGENVVNAYATAAYFLFISLGILLFFHKKLIAPNKS